MYARLIQYVGKTDHQDFTFFISVTLVRHAWFDSMNLAAQFCNHFRVKVSELAPGLQTDEAHLVSGHTSGLCNLSFNDGNARKKFRTCLRLPWLQAV